MTEHARSADDDISAAAEHGSPVTPEAAEARETAQTAWVAFLKHSLVCQESCWTADEDCGTAVELREKWRAARAKIGETETK
ncbi:hypothetical protein [Streptomyces sp. NPDC005970]|uniref:hypothetical protein n=1 Tax=Streptomyces sp. NPDC005970 TaxID=3156723 RepID=UPI0033D877FD